MKFTALVTSLAALGLASFVSGEKLVRIPLYHSAQNTALASNSTANLQQQNPQDAQGKHGGVTKG